MSFPESMHRAFSGVFRPMATIRGAGRLCRPINRWFLGNGISPIKTTNMRDGTRFLIDLRSQTEWYSFYSGSYDDVSIRLIQRILVSTGGDFLDVGGNIGMYAIRVAASLESSQCSICFEPEPHNVQRIRENIELNELGGRVHTYAFALSDKSGEADLILREDFAGGAETGNASVAISEEADRDLARTRVPCCRFDDIRASDMLGNLPVAKVDIEGHEDYFLAGAQQYLQQDRPIIFTEINNWFYEKRGTTSSAVFSKTMPAGYQALLLTVGKSACSLRESKIAELSGLQGIRTCIFCPDERRAVLSKVLLASS